MPKIELNGPVEKFDSIEGIEIEMQKSSKRIFKIDDYKNVLEGRIKELEIERKICFQRFEDLDNLRGNFEENYQFI